MIYGDPITLGPQASSCLSGRQFVGDPIDVVTGANTDITVDFGLHGPLPLLWCRYYSSARNTVAGPLGWGQTHDFNRTLTYDLDGLHYTDPFGKEVPFPPLAAGTCAVSAGYLLHRISEVTYELVQSGQPVEVFDFSDSSDMTPLCRLRQGEAQINFRYAGNGRLREIVDSLGRSIAVESDREGRILGLFLSQSSAPGSRRALMIYEYDASGNVIVAHDPHKATLGFRWDGYNRMTRRTDRRGYSFHFEYDDEGRCIHSRGDDGLLEVLLDYQPDLKTTIVRRGNGGQWTYYYDDAGTVTRIVDPYGGITSFTLDETGRVIEEVDPNGNAIRHLYDSAGRHYARLDPLGHMLPTYEANDNPPDPLAYELPETPLEWEHGELLRGWEIRSLAVDDPIFDSFPQAVRDRFLEFDAPGDPNGKARRAASQEPAAPSEDEQGRPVEQGSPGFMQRWDYDANGNLAEHRDTDGGVCRYIHGSWNALHREIDPLGHTTLFQHSSQGFVNRVQDPGGTVTEYTYDQKDRLSEVHRHGRVRERYRYDAAANMIEKTDDQGRTLVQWEVGPGNLDVIRRLRSGETHTFEYDERGRIVAAVTPEGTATFAFNEHGERVEDKRDGFGAAHEFARRELVATTCFEKFRTSYDTENNGDLVITDPTGARHRFKVSDGGLVAKHLASGVRELCLYDAAGRCCGKALAKSIQYRPSWIRSFIYSRAGDLLCATDTMQGTVSYRYDKAHRLTEEAHSDGLRRPFVYDSAGNLMVQPGLADVRMALGNRLQTANGDRFFYNDRDHLGSKEGPAGATRYEYNALDMLIRCDINGETWTASYDALCRRTRKTWRGETTVYYWDDFRLAAEVRQDGSLRLYVYEDHKALVPFMFVEYASLNSEPESGRRYYIFTNQIGVPVRVEDDGGRSCWSARIDPYGYAEVASDTTLEMPLRFPGHYHDSETGLHYNRFRYFNPELGRYLQSDPAGLRGGLNLYAYAVNPLIGADIDGLTPKRGGAATKPAKAKATGTKGEETTAGADADCPDASPTGAKPAKGNDDPKQNEERKRREQTGDDITLENEDAARREALKRHGAADTELYETKEIHGKNANLKGPKGEPSETLSTINKEGKIVEIDHHKWGHEFEDAGTYELPHYHGPNGEHISYPK